MKFDLTTESNRRHLEIAGQIAVLESLQVWLVGGPVRDLLLRRPEGDLDFVLEEQAERFAALLADRLGGTLRSFPRFRTFKILLPEGDAIDVTSSRAESYPRPGALPDVVPAPLPSDLSRRDFTINAMALDLRTGEIIDTTGGLHDLQSMQLRILHEGSFVDDPTRLFRGARLAVRLAFDLEPRTESRFHDAVSSDRVALVSRERIWREILLAFREPSPAAALAGFLSRGLLDRFLHLDPSAATSSEELLLAGASVEETAGIDTIGAILGCILAGNREPAASLEGASLKATERRRIEQIAGSVRLVADASGEVEDAMLFEMAARLPHETLVVAAALPRANGPRLRRLLGCLRHPIPFELDGGIVSGPHIGRAIEEARLALFTGDATPADVAAFARAKALQYLSVQA